MTPVTTKGKLFVISGPSGAGKSTIVRRVLERTGAVYSVSATTRRPRPGEIDGREYRFVDRSTFERMIRDGSLLEWAEVFGELYGTPAGPVQEALNAGRAVILEIDVQGALQVHEKMPEAVFILIEPPGREELTRRLQRRGTETPEAIRRRLDRAAEETDTAVRSGVYNYRVVNDDLDQAVEQVVEIINKESGAE